MVEYQEGMLRVGTGDWVPVLSGESYIYRYGINGNVVAESVKLEVELPDVLYTYSKSTRDELISLIKNHKDSNMKNTDWVDRGYYWVNDTTGRMFEKKTGKFSNQFVDMPGESAKLGAELIPITYDGKILRIGETGFSVPNASEDVRKKLIEELVSGTFEDILSERGYGLKFTLPGGYRTQVIRSK